MKVYRITFFDTCGKCIRYGYRSKLYEVDELIAVWRYTAPGRDATSETVTVNANGASVVAVLNKYASHPMHDKGGEG